MQTVVIWDEEGSPIQFFVADGDYRHLNGVYVNEESDDGKLDQLLTLVYKDDRAAYAVTLLDEFPVDIVKNGAAVIVAGFRA